MTHYTTPEASKITGIPDSTIRSWLTRYPGVFQINLHVVVEESGRKMWTDEGLELLRSRAVGKPFSDEEIADVSVEASFLDPVLDDAADDLARLFWQELPARTLQRINQMMHNPSDSDRELVQQSMQRAIAAGTHRLMPSAQVRRLDAED